jgi:hypothetical protein
MKWFKRHKHDFKEERFQVIQGYVGRRGNKYTEETVVVLRICKDCGDEEAYEIDQYGKKTTLSPEWVKMKRNAIPAPNSLPKNILSLSGFGLSNPAVKAQQEALAKAITTKPLPK